MKNDKTTFYEFQRLKRWLLALILAPINLIFIIGCVAQTGFGKSWGSNPMSDTGLIIITILTLLFTINMFFICMKTTIDRDGVHIHMWICPFYGVSKSFLWKDISESYIRKYSPIREYGGWGIRSGGVGNFGLRLKLVRMKGFNIGHDNIAYNMSGNIGLQLVLTNGKKVLIGTNISNELTEALQKIGKSRDELYGERKGK